MVPSLIILALIMPTGVLSKNLTVQSQSSQGPQVNITIDDAYYSDLNNDGLEMDVFARVSLVFNGANRYNMQYYITLTLPSGISWTYGYLINTRLDSIHLDNYFYNHAVEQGNYEITVQLVLKTCGVIYADASHIFDPPGGETRPPTAFDLAVW